MDDGDYQDPQLRFRATGPTAPSEEELRHVAAAPNTFERLARKWELEAKYLGGITKEIGAQWWRDFWAIWDEHDKTRMPTP